MHAFNKELTEIATQIFFLIIYVFLCSEKHEHCIRKINVISLRENFFAFSTKKKHQQPIAKAKTNFQIQGMSPCCDGWCMIGNWELDEGPLDCRDMELSIL